MLEPIGKPVTQAVLQRSEERGGKVDRHCANFLDVCTH